MQWVEDEAVVLDGESNELHYLNPQSALLYALLLEFGMPQAIGEALRRIENPPEEAQEELKRLVSSFIDKGILAES